MPSQAKIKPNLTKLFYMLYKTGKFFAGQPKNMSPRQSSYSISGNITKTIPELDEWIEESEGIKKGGTMERENTLSQIFL